MRELSYIILQELGRSSLGVAHQVLYSNSDICVRIQVDQECDTQEFRRLIKFLYAKQLKGLPRIIRFGQVSEGTVLVVSAQVGEPLKEVLRERHVSSALLDKWWNQMRDITSLLANQGLHLGTFSPDTLMISDSDELLIPLFFLTDRRNTKIRQTLSSSDDLEEVERLFLSTVSVETREANELAKTPIPEVSRIARRVKIGNQDKENISPHSRSWIRALRWLPTIILGIACLVSLSRVSSWAESTSQSSEHSLSLTNAVSDTSELPVVSVSSPEVLSDNQGVAIAREILARDVSAETIDEAYAKKLLTALETIRDQALNNLDYSEFMKVNVVGSPAASTESKLFHNLLDSGYRLKKYKMRFSQVKILQNTNEELAIRATIAQDIFLKCADQCISVTPEMPHSVKIVLVPRPWRIREVLREK